MQNDIKWTVYESGRSIKVHGYLKNMKVDSLRLRGLLKRDESARSSKVRGYMRKVKVNGLRLRGRSQRDESGRS